MSVGEEQTECPLCMEPLELDDINFFPCTCGYQICRFCWHRIRTDENGLCPACRKQYPEDPAEFKPLTEDELQRIKKERRQKDLQRKQKAAENRKHLANVRVVQKNLVFVVGLSQRLADVEVLRKHEYFGKFGKIHKVVINQSTSYAGAQTHGPSASAYVTYHKPEDALKAIQAVNNVYVDGRTLKSSLGTTKYCSHFLKGSQCPKLDCMYLHELGEEAASFTKEEMQQGKHQEYEQKLYETFMNTQNAAHHSAKTAQQPPQHPPLSHTPPQQQQTQQHLQQNARKKPASPPTVTQQSAPVCQHNVPPNTNKEAWPSLQSGTTSKPERLTNGNKPPLMTVPQPQKPDTPPLQNSNHRAPGANLNRHRGHETNSNGKPVDRPPTNSPSPVAEVKAHSPPVSVPQLTPNPIGANRKPFFDNSQDHLSLFSGNGFPPRPLHKPPVQPSPIAETIPTATEIPDTIPVSSSADWQTAFGFTSSTTDSHEDDLGFDPWNESTKALADLIEREQGQTQHQQNLHNSPRSAPPGFLPGLGNPFTINQPKTDQIGGSKIMNLMASFSTGNTTVPQPPGFAALPPNNTCHDVLSDIGLSGKENGPMNNDHDVFNTKDWQEGLRALLPNINISFGAPPAYPTSAPRSPPHMIQPQQKANSLSEDPPHWMKSLQQLTEIDSLPGQNHRLPFVQNFQIRGGHSWGQPAQNPPPGFQSQIIPPSPVGESQVAEGFH
ncbi:CCR4-NOT transcription complex subunit 4-like isoform X2 [Lineus longissimus]|uniref:CCR4-NOT transcription complex subunit 4-like isoform X2 n=1 Tax=Lineus longissimus TaxID=88925 RepID=UPI002B4EA0AB